MDEEDQLPEMLPSTGLWIREDLPHSKSERRMTPAAHKLRDLPDRLELAAMAEQYREEICAALRKKRDELHEALFREGRAGYSLNDIADTVIDAIIEAGFKESVRKSQDQP